MIWGLAKTREFTERSPHEVVVVTDHAPLQWIKHSIKGTVTSWLLQEVADIEYRVVYMSGKANTTAGAEQTATSVACQVHPGRSRGYLGRLIETALR